MRAYFLLLWRASAFDQKLLCPFGKKVLTILFRIILDNLSVQYTAVQLVFNPFSQIVPQLELYSQLQLSLWNDPIAFSVPKLT